MDEGRKEKKMDVDDGDQRPSEDIGVVSYASTAFSYRTSQCITVCIHSSRHVCVGKSACIIYEKKPLAPFFCFLSTVELISVRFFSPIGPLTATYRKKNRKR